MAYLVHYRVADQYFSFSGSQVTCPLDRVEGFRIFRSDTQPTLFHCSVDDILLKENEAAELLNEFSFEYIHARFSRIPEGFQFCMDSERSNERFIMHVFPQQGLARCNWERNQDLTILRFGLWMCLSIFMLPLQRVAIHSSVIAYDKRAVMFLGESGTGKSTHTALWGKHIAQSWLLNDDSPIVWTGKNEAGTPFAYAYGAPWSGKTPCYKDLKLPIAAVVRLSQAPHNRIRPLNRLEAFGALFPSAPPAFANDHTLTDGVCEILSNLILSTPVYHLECLPDEAAARLAFETIFRK